jgi:hypothetical protein
MVFWEVGQNKRITSLLVAHKGGRHQGSIGCDPNFRYSWELQAALAQGDDFLFRMQNEFFLTGWVATKLVAMLGHDVSDRVGDAR